MENESLEQTLINALSRLQHANVDKELLTDQERLGPEFIVEQHFGFTIGPHHFVVKASCFCEVFVDIPIAAVPNAPELLLGLCNVRGVLVPVYQLHGEWMLSRPTRTHIFCVGKGEKTIGLLVDGLPVSLSLSARDGVLDDTLEADSTLAVLVEKTFLARQMTHMRLDGEALGGQLLALANTRKRGVVVTGTVVPPGNVYSA